MLSTFNVDTGNNIKLLENNNNNINIDKIRLRAEYFLL